MSDIKWYSSLPAHWEKQRTKYLFKIISGNGFPVEMQGRIGEKYPFAKAGTISSSQRYLKKANDSVSQDDVNANGFNVIPVGSIVMPKIGEALKKNSSAVTSEEVCIDNNCQAMVPQNIDTDFAFYLLSVIDMNWYDNKGTIPSVNNQSLKNDKVPYPPLAEQHAIVRYLDSECAAIDEAIERHKKIIEKLEEYRKNEISYLSTKGLGDEPLKDSNTAWYGLIPQTWEVKRFKYIAQVKSNLVDPEPYLKYPQIGPDIIEKDSGRLIGYRTVEEAGIISGNHLFYEGQLLYSKVRPALNKVVTAPFDGLCSADMYPIETSINSDYLKYLMLSNPFLEQASIIAMIRVKMPKINQEELANIICVVPPVEQQTQVVESIKKMCEKVQSAIDKHKTVIAKLEEYHKSIIYNAVTGKIDCRTEAS